LLLGTALARGRTGCGLHRGGREQRARGRRAGGHVGGAREEGGRTGGRVARGCRRGRGLGGRGGRGGRHHGRQRGSRGRRGAGRVRAAGRARADRLTANALGDVPGRSARGRRRRGVGEPRGGNELRAVDGRPGLEVRGELGGAVRPVLVRAEGHGAQGVEVVRDGLDELGGRNDARVVDRGGRQGERVARRSAGPAAREGRVEQLDEGDGIVARRGARVGAVEAQQGTLDREAR